jgi:hypothetical protein
MGNSPQRQLPAKPARAMKLSELLGTQRKLDPKKPYAAQKRP